MVMCRVTIKNWTIIFYAEWNWLMAPVSCNRSASQHLTLLPHFCSSALCPHSYWSAGLNILSFFSDLLLWDITSTWSQHRIGRNLGGKLHRCSNLWIFFPFVFSKKTKQSWKIVIFNPFCFRLFSAAFHSVRFTGLTEIRGQNPA